MKNLITYNKILKQRNSALKKFAETRSFNAELVDIYDQQLIGPAQVIFEKRKEFIFMLLLELITQCLSCL